MVGPRIAETIAAALALGPAFVWSWNIVQWPVVFLLVTLAIAIVFHFAPDVEQDQPPGPIQSLLPDS